MPSELKKHLGVEGKALVRDRGGGKKAGVSSVKDLRPDEDFFTRKNALSSNICGIIYPASVLFFFSCV